MEKLKTIDFKGKPYVEVNERIRHFRTADEFKGWSLVSNIVKLEDSICVIQAFIYDEKGVKRATGCAYEKEDSNFINKTSYIENCETSAWGRALGCLGIGIDTAIASADEVGNAIKQQETPTAKDIFMKHYKKESTGIYKKLGMTKEQVQSIFKKNDKTEVADLIAAMEEL